MHDYSAYSPEVIFIGAVYVVLCIYLYICVHVYVLRYASYMFLYAHGCMHVYELKGTHAYGVFDVLI